jgi:hypothetical protein
VVVYGEDPLPTGGSALLVASGWVDPLLTAFDRHHF